jgi:hypothetical protein
LGKDSLGNVTARPKNQVSFGVKGYRRNTHLGISSAKWDEQSGVPTL